MGRNIEAETAAVRWLQDPEQPGSVQIGHRLLRHSALFVGVPGAFRKGRDQRPGALTQFVRRWRRLGHEFLGST